MKKSILTLLALSFCIASFADNYTKLSRNRIVADTLRAEYWLIINGDTLHSVNPTEGQIIKFVGGKYVNANQDALAADSMVFNVATGDLKIYRGGVAEIQENLDGRYATAENLTDTLSAYMSKKVYDPAGINTQVVGVSSTQSLTNKTLVTPTISSFVNATHDHSSAAQGGVLPINTYPINLPVAASVAGRLVGLTPGVDYPTGWTLQAGTSPVDLVITHNLGKDVAYVTVFSIDSNGKRLLISNAAYSGILAQSTSVLRIEALATIAKPILIQITFGR